MMLTCAWCDKRFSQPSPRGPVPRYCHKNCRQQAYEDRLKQRRRIEEQP